MESGHTVNRLGVGLVHTSEGSSGLLQLESTLTLGVEGLSPPLTLGVEALSPPLTLGVEGLSQRRLGWSQWWCWTLEA